MPLLSKYEITTVLPCIADTSKLRVIAKLDADIGDALPYRRRRCRSQSLLA
jgi:ArsR family metal-binding transcriptional regulator